MLRMQTLSRHPSAIRLHDAELAHESFLGQGFNEAAKIAFDHRLHIGRKGRRRGALILPEFAGDARRPKPFAPKGAAGVLLELLESGSLPRSQYLGKTQMELCRTQPRSCPRWASAAEIESLWEALLDWARQRQD